MIIKSDKKNIVLVMIPLMLILLSVLLLGTLYGAIPAGILIGVTTPMSVSYCVTIGRTITMDASGCRIEIMLMNSDLAVFSLFGMALLVYSSFSVGILTYEVKHNSTSRNNSS